MLYQEIRPTKFPEVVGNKSTIRSLELLSKRNPKDRPHTILLSGPKGCGKTTLAHILASEFGTNKDNVQELNTANIRGIETVRDIISNLNFVPFGGGSVTYILDECHQITKDAQQALLKETEDTPEHVYFILCTTDPQRLLPTLRNRCTEYQVEQLRSKDILTILERACKVKKLNVDPSILEVIASNCERTPRSALVMLEKVMDMTDLDEIADAIASEIDIQEGGDFFSLCKLLLILPEKRRINWKKVLEEVERLDQEPEQIRIGILTFMRKQLMKLESKDVEYAEDIIETMKILSESTFYGGKNLLVSLLMQVCFVEKL